MMKTKNYKTGIEKKDLLGWMAFSGILGFSILLFFANYFNYLDEKEQGFEFQSFHWPYSLFSNLCVHFSAAIVIGIIVILFIKKYTDLGLNIKFKELSKEINNNSFKSSKSVFFSPIMN